MSSVERAIEVAVAAAPALSEQQRVAVAALLGAAGTARPVPAAVGRADAVVVRVSSEGDVTVAEDVPKARPVQGGLRAQGGDRLLTVSEVATALGMSPSTWRGYVAKGKAPQPDDADVDRPANRRQPRWFQRTVTDWKANRVLGKPGPKPKSR